MILTTIPKTNVLWRGLVTKYANVIRKFNDRDNLFFFSQKNELSKKSLKYNKPLAKVLSKN